MVILRERVTEGSQSKMKQGLILISPGSIPRV
ncbi:hypothetical protein DFR64_3122 [Pelolinea submarina]|uniref:Uncharacterized protein n=1 Tax=Pelolinea submarina TaxID=913107 RepID=A0A3E0A339_9CHLR|nr:hypothetical protein DFR64_3122 [Pelolinea submarina]